MRHFNQMRQFFEEPVLNILIEALPDPLQHLSFCCLNGKLWYLQNNCVGYTIVYHKASNQFFPLRKSEHSGCNRSVAAIVLLRHDTWILVFHKERYQQPIPSQCHTIVENEPDFMFPHTYMPCQEFIIYPTLWWQQMQVTQFSGDTQKLM